MTAHYQSKHGVVSKSSPELYMMFCDLRNFTKLAEGTGANINAELDADFDSLSIKVQGFNISLRIDERRPYNLIRIISVESPVEFVCSLHFDNSVEFPSKTDFSIELDVNLNFMMKTMLGGKIQNGIDKAVDALVDISEGRKPAGL